MTHHVIVSDFVAWKCHACTLGNALTVCVLASATAHATVTHWRRLLRIVGYVIFAHNHALVLRPASLNIIVSADSSHAEHPDCKSHTGGCVGVKGDGFTPDSYFLFYSAKQSIVTKSSMESEMVAQDTMVDWGVWSAGIRDDLLSPKDLDSIAIQASQLNLQAGCLKKQNI